MISSLCWVPRGAAAAKPQTVAPDEDELAAIRHAAEQAAAGVLGDGDGDFEDDASSSDWESEEEVDAATAAEKARAFASALASGSGRASGKQREVRRRPAPACSAMRVARAAAGPTASSDPTPCNTNTPAAWRWCKYTVLAKLGVPDQHTLHPHCLALQGGGAVEGIEAAMADLDMDHYDSDDSEEDNIVSRVLGG